MITVGDLFAGIGGIAIGLQQAGFKIAWSNEIDKNACITYTNNFKHKMYEMDIQNLSPEKLQRIDMLVGGFPCQAFSIAGYRKGFDDIRGTLFFEIMRLTDALKPQYLFFENVKNLETHNNGNTFKVILNELETREYFVKYKVMNTSEYSTLPQNRERIYIVAFKNKKIYNEFKFPEKIKNRQSINKLLEDNVDDKFYYTDKVPFYNELKKHITRTDTVYQWRRVYVRENKNGLCPTLTANMGMGGHNVPLIKDSKGIRKLTPRECARLQGFPETYKFPDITNSALYKQMGNSVSIPIIVAIGKEIIRAIKKVK